MFKKIKELYKQKSKKYYWDGENWLNVVVTDLMKKYYLNGKIHRKDGPAKYSWNVNDVIRQKEYYINGKLHRIGKPAEFIYYENSCSIIFKKYYDNDYLHRTDGPAIIKYNKFGITEEEYYFKGIEFDPKKLIFKLPIDSPEKEFYLQLQKGK